jgi:hypothetical protein
MSDTNPGNQQMQMIDFAGKVLQKSSQIHFNLDQEFIVTTDDKIRLCLIKHTDRLEKRKAWITPLGIFITLAIVFPTTTFSPFFLDANTWEAIFIVATFLSFIWLIRTLFQLRKATSIQNVIDEIKRSSISKEKDKID